MKGAHDLGGKTGMGKINPEIDEPVFHHEWEKRAFAITLAAGFLGKWNLDMSRFARERMDYDEYLASSYYEKWIHGLECLLIEKGVLTQAEIHEKMEILLEKEQSKKG